MDGLNRAVSSYTSWFKLRCLLHLPRRYLWIQSWLSFQRHTLLSTFGIIGPFVTPMNFQIDNFISVAVQQALYWSTVFWPIYENQPDDNGIHWSGHLRVRHPANWFCHHFYDSRPGHWQAIKLSTWKGKCLLHRHRLWLYPFQTTESD